MKLLQKYNKFYTSSEPSDQTEAIDTLTASGGQEIDAITEVINLSDISEHVLNMDEEI
jgi:hypothetical protein